MPTISTNKKFWPHTICAQTLKLSILFILFTPGVAQAYIDPGSVSLIISSILGFLTAIAYTFRKYFQLLKSMLKKNKSKKDTVNSE